MDWWPRQITSRKTFLKVPKKTEGAGKFFFESVLVSWQVLLIRGTEGCWVGDKGRLI